MGSDSESMGSDSIENLFIILFPKNLKIAYQSTAAIKRRRA